MPRQRRLDIAGAVYHVITRGINRSVIFNDDADREEFLRRFEKALEQTKCECYGWVIMPNHFHLILRPCGRLLSDMMRKVLSGYAIYFNRRHKRCGYLFQNRYKSILCQEDKYLLELVRYVHLNPLRGKVVNSLRELDHFKWSGHSVLLGHATRAWQKCDEVLGQLGKTQGNGRSNYRQFIEDGMRMGRRNDLTGGGLKRSAGGWKELAEMKRAKEYWRGDERILGEGPFVDQVLKQTEEEMAKSERLRRNGWTLSRLIETVCKQVGVEKKDLLKRGRQNKIAEAKALIAYVGYRELGITGSELAQAFRCSRPAVSKAIQSGEKAPKGNIAKLLS